MRHWLLTTAMDKYWAGVGEVPPCAIIFILQLVKIKSSGISISLNHIFYNEFPPAAIEFSWRVGERCALSRAAAPAAPRGIYLRTFAALINKTQPSFQILLQAYGVHGPGGLRPFPRAVQEGVVRHLRCAPAAATHQSPAKRRWPVATLLKLYIIQL